MTERKFTAPTEFPAEYVDGEGRKVVLYGRGEGHLPLIGQIEAGSVVQYTEHGYAHGDLKVNLHDIPKRITTWHNVYANWIGSACLTRSDADETDIDMRIMKRLCVYRIERDEDGGNPEIFAEEA